MANTFPAINGGGTTLTNGNVVTGAGSSTLQDSGTALSTIITAGSSLTSNSVVLGAGSQATKVSTGITSNGASELDLGLNGTASGVLGLKGSTSGTATITAPSVAGVVSNAIAVSNAITSPSLAPLTSWWVFANLAGSNGAVFSSSANVAGIFSAFLPQGLLTGHVTYEIGTTADNTSATYDIGIYTGSPGGTGTLLANIGPTAGTTFAPSISTVIRLPWSQGTVFIPAGRVYIVTTTSQTGTPATMFRTTWGGATGLAFTINGLSVATGGTCPTSPTLPADSNGGLGSIIGATNIPYLLFN